MLSACSTFALPWIKGGTWTRPIPTAALALLERSSNPQSARAARDEIERRVNDGAVKGWSAGVLAAKLVRDLHNDHQHWNADRAENLLRSLWPNSQDALEQALQSDDVQTRILAARLLRALSPTPSESLLRACVEDLRNDSEKTSWYLTMGNAREAAEYFVIWGRSAAPHLEQAMHSNDQQQRLLAAAVAGHAHLTVLLEQAAPILINHLCDNTFRGDARVAAPALFMFGDAAIPFLQEHINSSDRQLAPMARSLIERIEHPDRSIHALHNPMPRITETILDPLAQYSIADTMCDLR
jgi:hypothetical protein